MLDTKTFIEKAKSIHGDKFDYSLVEYTGCNNKVKIICKKCGEIFLQTPHKHLTGHGCNLCIKNKKITPEMFLEKAKLIHGDKYEYDLTNFKEKVKIHCKTCGNDFEQKHTYHLENHGCPYCANNVKKTTKQFIEKAKLIHSNFDYSLINYVNNRTKVKIKCNVCNKVFEQLPLHHLNGKGCPVCEGLKTLSTEHFIEKAKLVHGDKYDYSLTSYVNNHTKVTIICPRGHRFEQKPNGHLLGYGCPFCKESKGEAKIAAFLNSNSVSYEREYIYENLKFVNSLRFDFYIKEKNLLIEYQGEQHYKPITFDSNTPIEKAKLELKMRRHRDWLKRNFARKNNIKLLIIPYWKFNEIENILEVNIYGSRKTK